MTQYARWSFRTAAVLLAAFFLALPEGLLPVAAQAPGLHGPATLSAPHRARRLRRKPASGKPVVAAAPKIAPKTTAKAETTKLLPRTPFTAADEDAAAIPGMPDARFWADSVTDFEHALPSQPGPWLALSTGGEDGAFGAGLLNGLSAAGKRPDYAVVTGVSTGALMAPFVFAGARYDDALRAAYTKITAADIFEVGATGESFIDSWPLKDLIAKEITPALVADIAAEDRKGRRLFVVTTDLDAQRSMVWNMGAIAERSVTEHGGDAALNLFRSVLLASGSIPGAFPPVLIDVEANGKHFQEMHVDGGVGGQFFVAPAALLASTSDYRLPATRLDVVINSGLGRDFQVVDRSTPSILTQAVGMAVKVDLRLMLDRTYVAMKRGGVEFNVATIPQSFNTASRGPFDPAYMQALFQAGYALGQSATPFGTEPPPYPGQPTTDSMQPEKTGAN